MLVSLIFDEETGSFDFGKIYITKHPIRAQKISNFIKLNLHSVAAPEESSVHIHTWFPSEMESEF